MNSMTSLERVRCALSGKEPDTVPIFDFVYSRPLYQEVVGHIPSYYNGEDVANCAAKIGYDLGVIPFGGFGGITNYDAGSDRYTDEWGTLFQKNPDTWPSDAPMDYPLKARGDLKNYSWPDPLRKERLKEAEVALRIAAEKKMAIFGSIRGPFSSTWLLVGIENFMLNLYDDPDFIDEVLTKCTDFFIAGGKRLAAVGVTALIFADDYGSNTGPLISPEHFHRHVLPQVRRMVSELRKTGVPVIMHSDGNINMFFDDLVRTDISGYHPVERSAGMKLGELKRRYGDRLTFLGNVDNKVTLVTGTSEQVEAEVKECIKAAAAGGRFILASDHSLHDDIPNKNVFALYDAGRRYGAYPISI